MSKVSRNSSKPKKSTKVKAPLAEMIEQRAKPVAALEPVTPGLSDQLSDWSIGECKLAMPPPVAPTPWAPKVVECVLTNWRMDSSGHSRTTSIALVTEAGELLHFLIGDEGSVFQRREDLIELVRRVQIPAEPMAAETIADETV